MYFYEEDNIELNAPIDISESNDLSQERPWDAARLKRDLFDYLYKVNARFPRVNNNQ